jgi:hypothetical protein
VNLWCIFILNAGVKLICLVINVVNRCINIINTLKGTTKVKKLFYDTLNLVMAVYIFITFDKVVQPG